LAKLYERYGARLLEQNVRLFLQFTGKINKEIRKMLNFNTERNILPDEENDFLFDILNSKRERDYDADVVIVKCLQKLTKKGFTV
jgi:hypothetical protein